MIEWSKKVTKKIMKLFGIGEYSCMSLTFADVLLLV